MFNRKALCQVGISSLLLLGSAALVSAPASASNVEDLPLQASVACVGSNAIDSVVYKVNGTVVPQLSGGTSQGDTVSVEFTVKPECGNVLFGLAAYKAESPDFDPATAQLQVLVDSSVGVFAAGAVHMLSVTTPSCFYQVDFFTGAVLNPLGDPELYSDTGRLIAWDTAGIDNCVEVEETTTTRPQVTTSTTSSTTSTSSTLPTEVLGESVERPEVLGAELAETGFATGQLVGTGSGLVLLGSALSGLALRLRSRGKHFRNN